MEMEGCRANIVSNIMNKMARSITNLNHRLKKKGEKKAIFISSFILGNHFCSYSYMQPIIQKIN